MSERHCYVIPFVASLPHITRAELDSAVEITNSVAQIGTGEHGWQWIEFNAPEDEASTGYLTDERFTLVMTADGHTHSHAWHVTYLDVHRIDTQTVRVNLPDPVEASLPA